MRRHVNAEPYPIERRRAQHRRRRGLRLLALAAITGGAIWAGWFSTLLAVQNVAVSGNAMTSAADVLRVADIKLGTSLLTVDSNAISERLQSIHEVESVEVRRIPLHDVRLVITERTPIATFLGSSGWQLVDRFGVVFGNLAKKPADLLVVTAASTTGRAAAAEVAVALPSWLAAQVISVKAGSADDVRLQLTGDRMVLWGSVERIERKLAVLQPLLAIKAKVYDVSAPDMPTTRR